MDLIRHVLHADGHVGVALDIGHAAVDLRRYALGELGRAAAGAKIHQHHILQPVYVLDGLHLLALQRVEIRELIGALRVEPAGDRGQHADLGRQPDQRVLGLAQRCVGQLALGGKRSGLLQEALQPIRIALLDVVVQLLFKGIGAAAFFVLLGVNGGLGQALAAACFVLLFLRVEVLHLCLFAVEYQMQQQKQTNKASVGVDRDTADQLRHSLLIGRRRFCLFKILVQQLFGDRRGKDRPQKQVDSAPLKSHMAILQIGIDGGKLRIAIRVIDRPAILRLEPQQLRQGRVAQNPVLIQHGRDPGGGIELAAKGDIVHGRTSFLQPV